MVNVSKMSVVTIHAVVNSDDMEQSKQELEARVAMHETVQAVKLVETALPKEAAKNLEQMKTPSFSWDIKNPSLKVAVSLETNKISIKSE